MTFKVNWFCAVVCFLPFFIISGDALARGYIDPIDAPAMQSPRAAKSMLIAVSKVPDATPASWVAVGRRGVILLSSDGRNWQQAVVPVSTDLVSVFFVNSTHGWAVGHDGVILATSDGGKRWQKQLDGHQLAAKLVSYYEQLATASNNPDNTFALNDAKRLQEDGPSRPFLDVWFRDEKQGYAVGAYNLIFMTEDGGTTWTPQAAHLANPKGLHLNAIRVIGNVVYIAAEQGLLTRLNRVTGNFDMVKVPYVGSFFGLVGKENLLLLFGLQSNVFRSSDGGVSWQKLDTGLTGTIASGTLLEDGRLVLASQNGLFAISSDNGDHFSVVTPAVPGNIYGVASGPAKSVILVGPRGVRTEALK